MATFLGLDYPTWWFLVIGGLFSGYAILDGFDLGAGALHLFFRKEESRRIALNAVGPVWDGNEVWLVIGGGAMFAGFPLLYASLLSAMYIPMMLFLFGIIFRAISIEFRSKEPMAWWRRMWDIAYSISSIALAVLLGILLGNVLQGIPLGPDYVFRGSWLVFLNPFALLVGLTSLALFTVHGAIYLAMKTEGRLFVRVKVLLWRATAVFAFLFVATTAYTLLGQAALYDRLMVQPWLAVFPLLAFLSLANVPRLASKKRFFQAFLFSSLSIGLLLMLVAIELYPILLTSTVDPKWNITIYNAASSDKTIGIMLFMVAIGAPLVLGYTVFVYRTFKGKVKIDETSY
jgi:cytochrome bd ubiquinol oxidase subunit II